MGRWAEWFRRASRIVIASVVTGVSLLAAGHWIGPEHVSLLALAQYAPYPVWLLPSVAALGLSALLGWPWRAAAALALVAVATVVMGLEVNRGEPGGTGRLRVMTYNVKDYVTLRNRGGITTIVAEISKHDPDIVLLQDARSLPRILRRNPATARALFGNRQQYTFGQYVVASRHALRDCSEGDIPIHDERHTFVRCTVVFGAAEFDVIAVHLMTPRFGLRATIDHPIRGIGEWRENVSVRMGQAEQLASELRLRTRPVIVAGDLNAPVSSLAVRTLLKTGLSDAFSTAGLGYGHTWGHSLRFGQSFLRIDHILVSPEFGVADCFVGGSSSAHRPVIADLYLKDIDG